jgi:HPt (histidine-containing phosphotransfer) domain-containing protein
VIQDIAQQLELDFSTVKRLMRKFLHDAENSLIELRAAVEEGDRDRVGRIAHKVGGTAGNLRIETISSLAYQIEDEFDTVSSDILQQYPDLLAEEIQNFADILRREDCENVDKEP